MNSGLGFTPNNDGEIIRINVPQLTEERRKEMVKLANSEGENAKVFYVLFQPIHCFRGARTACQVSVGALKSSAPSNEPMFICVCL